MYLTAQHVRSLASNKDGINAFLYRHGQQPVAGMSWEWPDVGRVADGEVGELFAEYVELTPRGNDVLSYLDVVSADATPVDYVENVLGAFGGLVTPEGLPVSRQYQKVAVRFGAQFGLHQHVVEEYRALSERAVYLLRHPVEPPWRSMQPVTVVVEHDDDGLVFTLTDDSKARLRTIHGPNWSAPRIKITHETKEDFEAQHGDAFANLAPVFTGLGPERTAELGGVRYVDKESQRAIAEWPKR